MSMMAAFQAFFLTSLAACASALNPTGISFNETLKGFGTAGGSLNDTIEDFERYYAEGKVIDETMSFDLAIKVDNVDRWLNDTKHAATCRGHVEESAISAANLTVADQSNLRIFDGGVLPTHELMMEYSLFFNATQNANPHLMYGVKHIYGDDCIDLLKAITTLYVHVSDTETKKIERTGIVKIGLGNIIDLVLSMRITGDGTLLQKVEGFLKFAKLLVGDVLENCLNLTAYETDYWYYWASDGTNGALLDLVKRPESLELRLVQYSSSSAPVVTKQSVPLSNFSLTKDSVRVGDVTMNFAEGVQGSMQGDGADGAPIDISAKWQLDGRTNEFLPPVLDKLAGKFLPRPTSAYGSLQSGRVGAVDLAPGTPFVRTVYPIPVGLKLMKWTMISCQQFDGSDLQLELVGLHIDAGWPLPDLGYVAPTYVFIDGKEHKLDGLSEVAGESVKVFEGGALGPLNRERKFVAEIQMPAGAGAQTLFVNCSAPAASFAFLDKEGHTDIHTTVMGSCHVAVERVSASGEPTLSSYESKNRCLLEIKD